MFHFDKKSLNIPHYPKMKLKLKDKMNIEEYNQKINKKTTSSQSSICDIIKKQASHNYYKNFTLEKDNLINHSSEFPLIKSRDEKKNFKYKILPFSNNNNNSIQLDFSPKKNINLSSSSSKKSLFTPQMNQSKSTLIPIYKTINKNNSLNQKSFRRNINPLKKAFLSRKSENNINKKTKNTNLTFSENPKKTQSKIMINSIKSSQNINNGKMNCENETILLFSNILGKGYSFSKGGRLEDGSEKINQDSTLILDNIFNLNYNVQGVMDGHGKNGHLVSQFIKNKLTNLLLKEQTYFPNKKNYPKSIKSDTFKIPMNNNLLNINKNNILTEELIYFQLINKNFSLIKSLFSIINKELKKESFDISFSGSTLLLIFQINHHIICANTGDSRCIIITSHNSKYPYSYEQLSIDHKPFNSSEKKRIEHLGGEIHKCKEENGPLRIWVKGEDFPGLAVSRSIGDSVAKEIGVIYEPDVISRIVEDKYKVIIIASDGLWDVMNEEIVTKITKLFFEKGDASGLCIKLVEDAVKIWDSKGKERDDISVVCSFIGKRRIFY